MGLIKRITKGKEMIIIAFAAVCFGFPLLKFLQDQNKTLYTYELTYNNGDIETFSFVSNYSRYEHFLEDGCLHTEYSGSVCGIRKMKLLNEKSINP